MALPSVTNSGTSTLGVSKPRSRGVLRLRIASRWALPFAIGCGALAVGWVYGGTTWPHADVLYELAFLSSVVGGLVGIQRASPILRFAWHANPVRLLALGGRTVLLATVAAGAPPLVGTIPGSLAARAGVGILQIAAIGLLVLQLPIRPAARGLLLVASIFVGPHVLGQPGQLLFGADRWFRADGFPATGDVFGPILVLISLSCALHGLHRVRRVGRDLH